MLQASFTVFKLFKKYERIKEEIKANFNAEGQTRTKRLPREDNDLSSRQPSEQCSH